MVLDCIVSPMNLLPPMLPSYGVLTPPGSQITCFRQCTQGSSATFRIFLGFTRFKYADTFLIQPVNFPEFDSANAISLSDHAVAEQLVHLYVQKGHAASDCKRSLNRPKKTAVILQSAAKRLCVCVCVSHSASKSSKSS